MSGPPQPASWAEPLPRPCQAQIPEPQMTHSLRIPGVGVVWALPGPQVRRGLGSLVI